MITVRGKFVFLAIELQDTRGTMRITRKLWWDMEGCVQAGGLDRAQIFTVVREHLIGVMLDL